MDGDEINLKEFASHPAEIDGETALDRGDLVHVQFEVCAKTYKSFTTKMSSSSVGLIARYVKVLKS